MMDGHRDRFFRDFRRPSRFSNAPAPDARRSRSSFRVPLNRSFNIPPRHPERGPFPPPPADSGGFRPFPGDSGGFGPPVGEGGGFHPPPGDRGGFGPLVGDGGGFHPPTGGPPGGFWPMSGAEAGGGFGNEYMGPPRPMMPPQGQPQPPSLSGQKRGIPFPGRGGSPDEHDSNGEPEIPSRGIAQRKTELPREQREYLRFMKVGRKKDFICLERCDGKVKNILQGLELHTGVFSAVEQRRIVDNIYDLLEKGKRGELKERTYTAPRKWMKGKGRVTIQFGCCYNYATDKKGNPPGILKHEEVDPLPSLFKVIIKRLIRWHVLPPSCVPDSCIVNIYEEGDCIPPHIDSHDFVRPFCTISFLSECNILFGKDLKIEGPGEFSGAMAIPLPVGSVMVLNGNGADVAKHCVPAVPSKRISITFRKMDKSKLPDNYAPEPDLQGLEPLCFDEEGAKQSSPPQYVLRQ